MFPRMGVEANYFRGGEREYFECWQYLGSICCEHSKYLRVQHSWYSEYSNHFGCSYCRYCLLYSGFCNAHHTPSTHSQYLSLQYSYCSYSQYSQYFGHHVLEYCNTLSTSSIQSIEHRILPVQAASEKKYRTPYIWTHCTTQQHDAPTHIPTVVLTLVSGVQQ